MELNEQQRQILMYALGFEKGKRSSRRNFYICISGVPEEPLIKDMIRKGFLEPHKEMGGGNIANTSPHLFSASVYSVTDLGIQTITEIVESQKTTKTLRKSKNGKNKR